MSTLDRLKARRSGAGFNLAFLDIMACGLGAVILLFLIIKHNTANGSVESEVLLTRLETMQRESQRLQTLLDDVAQKNSQEELLGESLKDRAQSSKTVLAAIDSRMTAQENQNAQLRESNRKTEEKIAQDFVQGPGAGEEQYFMGLLVEGPRIAILLDHSGSMTDEKLLDVVRYKVSSDAEKKLSPKWQRAKKTLKWLLNRVPEKSQVVVVGFGESAQWLGASSWFDLSATEAVNGLLAASEQLVPQGPTNLESAFARLGELSAPPTNIYLVTDGLPTRVQGQQPRCARGPTVTGKCRSQLFGTTVQRLKTRMRGASLSVVLFPLEGDWEAADRYWRLASAYGGQLISPPESWP
ncbi:MAG: vWA domain-containing protein [Pseudomonadota bacterium]